MQLSTTRPSRRRVYALVPDLFFMTKIGATAASLGVIVEELRPGRAITACRNVPPDLLLLDLESPGDPVEVVRVLKANEETRGIRVVAFHSHVDRALGEAARNAGADHVLPRSAFSVKLPAILRGEGP